MVLTGKRGGFGAMKPMLRLLRDSSCAKLQLVATDQHTSPKFGETISEVNQEFDVAAAVDMMQPDDSEYGRACALGKCFSEISRVVYELKPDVCVVYGDRGEVLVTASVSTVMGIPIAHIQGGDVSGSIDEQVRHSVTKLAHLHFPSTEESGLRIKKMGEEEWRIHVVGDCHLDLIAHGEYLQKEVVAKELNLDMDKPIVIVLQHSETTAPREARAQMEETLHVVKQLNYQTVVVYPSSDSGYQGIIDAIKEHAVGPNFRVEVNLPAEKFWGLMSIASVIVGNSSCGIIETPTFRLPAINIGRRQERRLCADNVIHVPHNRDQIRQALWQVENDKEFINQVRSCRQPYGDGCAGSRIAEVLQNVPVDEKLMVKRITY